MELKKLYDICDKENIQVYDHSITGCKGVFLNYNNINAIAINNKLVKTYTDLKCTLAHELGHYYTGATYSLCADANYISKMEYKANRWTWNTLIPIQDLKLAVSKGNTTSYSLAEYFSVTYDFMQDCLIYYKRRALI